jgi:uncharacterized protein with PIN domain
MELLWCSVVLAYVLGSTIYFGLDFRPPRCRDCHTSALMLSQQIAGSSPPIFEVVYRCPSCHAILWKRFVSTIAD